MYAICFRYTQDADASKDMVQNIFITLWERDSAIPDEEGLQKYLSKAARYQILKRNRTPDFFHLEKLDETLPGSKGIEHENPHQYTVYREMRTKIENEIALLKEPAKSVFILSYFHALSHKEIALRLGIAVKTVEYHLTRAKKFILKKTR